MQQLQNYIIAVTDEDRISQCEHESVIEILVPC